MLAAQPTLAITTHARERIVERFNVAPEKVDAWVQRHWPKAEFIAVVTTERTGKPARAYVKGDICFILDRAEPVLITVYQRSARSPWAFAPDFNARLATLVRAEIERLNGLLPQITADTMREKLALETELTTRRRAYLRATTDSRRLALQARINAIELRLLELTADEARQKRDIARQIEQALQYA
jgi:hypothetical protein